MLGALYRYVHTADPAHFQPMNANFGLLEPLAQPVRDKQRKKQLLVERALAEIDHFAERIGVSKNAECGVRNAEKLDTRRPRDRRVRGVPGQGAERLAAHGEGVRARRGGVRGVLRSVLRRPVELGRRGPARDPRLPRKSRGAGPGAPLGRAGAVGAAHVLPLLEPHPGGAGQSREERPHPEAGGPAARLPRPRGDRAAVRPRARPGAARACAAPFVRDAPARRRSGPAGGAGAPGARLAQYDAGVYSYVGGASQEGLPPGPSAGLSERDMGTARCDRIHATTILCVRRDGHVAIGGDGQVTIGDTVMKANANKVRTLKGGKILAGFAGAAADAFTLFEKFEEKLERYPGNLPRAAVEAPKDLRADRGLRRAAGPPARLGQGDGYAGSRPGRAVRARGGAVAPR